MKPKKNERQPRPDEDDAFAPLADDEAESFAEEFIATATSGEFVGEDARDEAVAEELGGPFIELVVVMPNEDEP